MKKIFTLAAISLMAIGAYAQDQNPKAESWYVNNEDGTLKDVYVANSDPSAMSVVEFSTENVTGTHTSGPIAGYIDGELPLEENVDNSWSGIQTKELSKDGSVAPFYYVQGTGNPVNIDKIQFEEIITDDEPTGVWRANWDDAYYEIDGSNGLPTNGTYVTLTPKVNGTFIVAAWINKSNREVYVVKKSDMKALAPNTEVKASGYVNGTNWGDDEVAEDSPLYGYPMYQESIEISDAYIVGAGNQATWAYLTFDAEADETYYVFNKSTQIGFSGYEFTPEDNGDGDGNEGGEEGTTSIEESWEVYDIVDGVATLKSDYVANSDASAMSVVEFSTDNVKGTHTSGPIAGYIDGPELPLAENVDNTWGGLSNKALSADGSIATFYYVQGKGNPVNLAKIDFEEVVTDGVPTGVYRAKWDDAYYEPDGSNGLPTNGTYVTLTPSVDGTFTVAAWINKGDREIYVVKGSDMIALSYAKGEIKASGYNNGIVYTEDETADSNILGYPMYQEEFNTLDENGNDTWIMPESTNQQVEAYLTFAAEADETYYIFNKSTQIGFSGFEFEYEDVSTGIEGIEFSITEIETSTNDANAPIYNLAGQRVTKNAKGILIQNGKKYIAK